MTTKFYVKSQAFDSRGAAEAFINKNLSQVARDNIAIGFLDKVYGNFEGLADAIVNGCAPVNAEECITMMLDNMEDRAMVGLPTTCGPVRAVLCDTYRFVYTDTSGHEQCIGSLGKDRLYAMELHPMAAEWLRNADKETKIDAFVFGWTEESGMDVPPSKLADLARSLLGTGEFPYMKVSMWMSHALARMAREGKGDRTLGAFSVREEVSE